MSWFQEVDWSTLAFYLRSAIEIGLLWILLYHVLLAFERISAG